LSTFALTELRRDERGKSEHISIQLEKVAGNTRRPALIAKLELDRDANSDAKAERQRIPYL